MDLSLGALTSVETLGTSVACKARTWHLRRAGIVGNCGDAVGVALQHGDKLHILWLVRIGFCWWPKLLLLLPAAASGCSSVVASPSITAS